MFSRASVKVLDRYVKSINLDLGDFKKLRLMYIFNKFIIFIITNIQRKIKCAPSKLNQAISKCLWHCLLFWNNVAVFFMSNAIVSSRNHKSQNVSDNVKEVPQSHTTDRQMAPRGRAKEWEQRHETQNTTKVKQPALSSKTRWLRN